MRWIGRGVVVVVMVMWMAGGVMGQPSGVAGVPGDTKSFSLSDTLQNVGALYMGVSSASSIVSGTGKIAKSFWLSATTNAAVVCMGDAAPTATCHPLPTSTLLRIDGDEWGKRVWVKNGTVGSTVVLSVTPEW